MSKFIFNVRWDDGSTYSYEVEKGKTGFGVDPIAEAKNRLNASRSVMAYSVIDEIGNIVYSMGDSNGRLTRETG